MLPPLAGADLTCHCPNEQVKQPKVVRRCRETARRDCRPRGCASHRPVLVVEPAQLPDLDMGNPSRPRPETQIRPRWAGRPPAPAPNLRCRWPLRTAVSAAGPTSGRKPRRRGKRRRAWARRWVAPRSLLATDGDAGLHHTMTVTIWLSPIRAPIFVHPEPEFRDGSADPLWPDLDVGGGIDGEAAGFPDEGTLDSFALRQQ